MKNPVSVDTVGHSLVGGARETEKVIFCCNILWGECMHKVMCLCTFTLQVLNSLGDKFSHWDSQYETLITHYEKKTTETMLNVSYFEKIMSHWEYI